MKKTTLVLLALYLNTILLADNYKILQINTSSVKIGNQLCKIGDVFSDETPILWSNAKQALKAMNLQTKQIRLFVANNFFNTKAKSVKDYYIKTNHLSTRGGMISFSDLADELSDTIYLYDTMQIESPIKIDSISSYLISYVQDGEKMWRTLMSTDNHFFFSRELFCEDIDGGEYTLTLYFRKKGMKDYMISDSVEIVLLPLHLDNKE